MVVGRQKHALHGEGPEGHHHENVGQEGVEDVQDEGDVEDRRELLRKVRVDKLSLKQWQSPQKQ